MNAKVGRNDPCPCGSSAKFKRCCGAPKQLPVARECGECSACCTALGVPEVKTLPGSPCDHAMAGGGCGVYSRRPRPCRDYRCEWIKGALPAGWDGRPDLVGLVIDDGVKPGFRALWGPNAVTVRELRDGAADEPPGADLIEAYYRTGAAIFIVRADATAGRRFICADPVLVAKAQRIAQEGGHGGY